MSPRAKRLRKISKLPIVSGFKPYGQSPGGNYVQRVFLHIEEYEAIRLCDYEMMNHHQAAVAMDVSRPTLTRIYARARQKIAQALVEGSQIIIEGGKIYFDSDWYSCSGCGCFFNHPEKEKNVENCPLCGSNQIENCENIPDEISEPKPGCKDMCVCPKCGFTKEHQLGKPCLSEICPDCNIELARQNQSG